VILPHPEGRRACAGRLGVVSALVMTELIYRIADPAALAAASLSGAYEGEAHDKADGFIHASTLDQLADTLQIHYAEAERLGVAEIEVSALGDTLKWEKSRGGELFPHIYGPVPFSAIIGVHLIKRDEEGAWRLPPELSR
jgi:beta-hydroxylase